MAGFRRYGHGQCSWKAAMARITNGRWPICGRASISRTASSTPSLTVTPSGRQNLNFAPSISDTVKIVLIIATHSVVARMSPRSGAPPAHSAVACIDSFHPLDRRLVALEATVSGRPLARWVAEPGSGDADRASRAQGGICQKYCLTFLSGTQTRVERHTV